VEKQRFNCLHSVDPEKVCTIIMACAVHHNIAVNLRDSLEDVPDTDMDETSINIPFRGPEEGHIVRDHFAQTSLVNEIQKGGLYVICVDFLSKFSNNSHIEDANSCLSAGDCRRVISRHSFLFSKLCCLHKTSCCFVIKFIA
jgi:hypothetical protein